MQMESLSWCLGQLGPVRPLGSTLRFPDGEEWYVLRPYHQPLVSPDVPSDRHVADALRRAGGAGAAGWPPLGSDRPADGPLLSRMAPAPRYSSLNA